MKTSSFNKYRGDNGVSIALYPPPWYNGKKYPALAPPADLLKWWSNSLKGNAEWSRYSDIYHEQVLFKLKPKEIIKEIRENAVLLCWCAPGEPCHRRLVADFLEFNLGIDIPEWIKPRTGTQNRSLHKYFTDLANSLNDEGYTQRSFMEFIRGKLDLPVTIEFCKKIFLQVASVTGIDGDLRSIKGDKFYSVYQSFSPAIERLTGVSVSLSHCNKIPGKYLELLADKLDSAGHTQNAMFDSFKPGFDLRLDGDFVKEVFREVMKNMTGKKSTTELSTVETMDVFKAFDRAISEKTGVRCEWPCIDNMEDKK